MSDQGNRWAISGISGPTLLIEESESSVNFASQLSLGGGYALQLTEQDGVPVMTVSS